MRGALQPTIQLLLEVDLHSHWEFDEICCYNNQTSTETVRFGMVLKAKNLGVERLYSTVINNFRQTEVIHVKPIGEKSRALYAKLEDNRTFHKIKSEAIIYYAWC